MVVAVWLVPDPKKAARHASARLIVYYANETLPDLGRSAHYKRLFNALEATDTKRGRRAIDGIKHDLRVFPKLVEKEIADLLRHAKRLNIHAKVFSNRLTVQGRYLSFVPGSQKWTVKRFPGLSKSGEMVELFWSIYSRPVSGQQR